LWIDMVVRGAASYHHKARRLGLVRYLMELKNGVLEVSRCLTHSMFRLVKQPLGLVRWVVAFNTT